MSVPNINKLLDLWASTLLKHNEPPPFANHLDLYNTIDSTPLGDVAWQSFSIWYDGDVPEGTVPQWMTSEYFVTHIPSSRIWLTVRTITITLMLPRYRFSTVMAPEYIRTLCQEIGLGKYNNFYLVLMSKSLILKEQDKIPKTQQHMVQCSFLSSWEATKPQCLSQPATMSTIHYMSQLALSTTIFAKHIAGRLPWSHSLRSWKVRDTF